MTNIVNLTPHAINVHGAGGELLIAIPASGQVARLASTNVLAGSLLIGGISLELYRTEHGEATGLPEPTQGVTLLVSGLVRAALPERSDLASPGALLRDDKGRPIGCTGLAVN